MDVRVVHDGSWIHPGGGARVAKELAKALDAPITVGHCETPDFWREDPGVEVDIPFQKELHGPLAKALPQPALELRLGQLFRSLEIDAEIVVTSGTAAKWIVPRAEQRHVHYCHVPPPRFYGEGQGGTKNPLSWGMRETGALFDQHYSGFVDQFIANSEWTRKRVQAHYRQDASVLHPPIRTGKFHWMPPSKDTYFVMICGRVVDMKRPTVVAEAFGDLDARLAIVGDGPLREECEQYDGVSVYPDLSDWGVEQLVARSAGGIAFAEGEHCGITPKEMQAAGKPVVVPDEPNLCNHVTDGETGVIVYPSVAGVRGGVKKVLESTWNREEIEQSAAEWDTDVFHERARDLILDRADTAVAETEAIHNDD